MKIQILPFLFPIYLQILLNLFCGFHHTLFLDSEGNLFSVGDNVFGQLGKNTNVGQKRIGSNIKYSSSSKYFLCW